MRIAPQGNGNFTWALVMDGDRIVATGSQALCEAVVAGDVAGYLAKIVDTNADTKRVSRPPVVQTKARKTGTKATHTGT